MYSLKDKACIAGVGESAFSRGSGKTELQLMLDASTKAIADAGLKPHNIDGIIGPPLGAASEHIAANLGIEDMRYATTVHMGGASPVVSLQSAAMAIASGVATNVLIPLGWNGYSSNPVRGGGARADTGEKPMPAPNPLQNTIGAFYLPYGATVPVQCAVVAVVSLASIAAFIAARLRTRRSLVAKRGSARNSGRASASIRRW